MSCRVVSCAADSCLFMRSCVVCMVWQVVTINGFNFGPINTTIVGVYTTNQALQSIVNASSAILSLGAGLNCECGQWCMFLRKNLLSLRFTVVCAFCVCTCVCFVNRVQTRTLTATMETRRRSQQWAVLLWLLTKSSTARRQLELVSTLSGC